METFLLFLLVTLLGICSTHNICPKSCNCTLRSYNSGIANCKILDPKTQIFSVEIATMEMINVQKNDHFHLKSNLFYDVGLKSVSAIKIVNSSLMEVDIDTFHGLKLLKHVDLSHNLLKFIHPETFKNNTELKILKLNHNPLQLPSDSFFLNNDHLTELDISNCNLVELSPQVFLKMQNLQTINLSYNKIKILDPGVFSSLDFIVFVNLAFNEIGYLSPDTLTDSEDMTTLILKGNPITSLDELNISELKDLDASECDMTGLFASSLEGINEINLLNLSNNAIETIDSDAFSSLSDLSYLYLSNNNLKGPLSEFIFEQNTRLEVISFSGNPNLIHLNGFKGEFLQLHYYDISYCGLFDITNNTFNNMHFIATLNISGNHLQHIQSKAFSKLSKLTILDLSNNILHYLPLKIFSMNRDLQKLYLGNNLFHHIPAALFISTHKLLYLDVSYSQLNYLWNVTESVMMKNKGVLENLVNLNVAGNRLKKLHLQNFISLKNLGQLDISNNPIECTQSFAHVIEWLILHRVLPNKGKINHPISISDELYNNVDWDETLNKVCPLPSEEEPLMIEQKVHILSVTEDRETDQKVQILSVTEKASQFEKLEQSTDAPVVKKEESFSYLTSSESDYVWPLTLIAFAGLCLILALGNISFLMIYKARRNYRLVSYKSHFPNPLGGLSQVRHKNATMYQKLYEDCSVPKTPIVKNSHGKCVVTCISDAEKAEAV